MGSGLFPVVRMLSIMPPSRAEHFTRHAISIGSRRTATANFARRPMKKTWPNQSGPTSVFDDPNLSIRPVPEGQFRSDNQNQYRWGSSVGESGGFITRRSGVQIPPPPSLTVARFRVWPFLFVLSRLAAMGHFGPAERYGAKRRQVAAPVAARCH